MSECVMNETQILVNGKLDKAAALKVISDQFKSNPDVINVGFRIFLKRKTGLT